MFKAIRIGVLLLILFSVSVSTWLTQARSTDWNDSLWVKIYPINGDGSQVAILAHLLHGSIKVLRLVQAEQLCLVGEKQVHAIPYQMQETVPVAVDTKSI